MHLALLEEKNRELTKFNQGRVRENIQVQLVNDYTFLVSNKYFNVIFRRKHIYFFLNAFFISVVELCRNKQLTIASRLQVLCIGWLGHEVSP